MKLESVVFGLAGMLFGLMVGWIIGSQQAVAPVVAPPPAAQADAGGGTATTANRPPPELDQARVAELQRGAEERPNDAAPRAQLGNLYFDAERFEEAIRWYEAALELDPKDVNVSTDLGVSYYYTNQPDRALQQFEHSLSVDPRHTKTILNMGIVRAFGKQDLEGAVVAWQRVVDLAPDSPEGRAARQALDSVRAAHPDVAK